MTSLPASTDPFYCGCEAVFGPGDDGLLSVDAALKRGLALARPVEEVERLPLDRAHGRVLAGEVRAGVPLPLFDSSAMDGYAVRRADLGGEGPWWLPVAGRVAAGDAGDRKHPAGAAMRIFTGAPIPPGCDAVVVQEAVRRQGNAIRLERRPAPRRTSAVPARTSPSAPACCRRGGASGRARQAARRDGLRDGDRPAPRAGRALQHRLGLRSPGTPLAPGQVWNANRSHLTGSLDLPWVELTTWAACPTSRACCGRRWNGRPAAPTSC